MAAVPLQTSPVPVGSLDATGTADATTYLRGDGSWETPEVGGGGGGGSSNLQYAQKTDYSTFSVAQDAETGDVTGLTLSVTPSSASAVIEVRFDLVVGISSASAVMITCYRDGSPVGVGDAAGARKQISCAVDIANGGGGMGTASRHFFDEPATTSEVTYSLRLSHISTSTLTIGVNGHGVDADLARRGRAASTISAREVA